MKETRFIAQNKQKWQEAEALLKSPVKDPEKLGNLFVQVVDDLSYSRTYYPNRSVRVYLNKIARQYFSIIYSHKKEKRNQFKLFWFDELPQIILHCKRELIVSSAVFIMALAIGIFSSIQDPEFLGTIVGQDYIAQTNENIEKGDPMAIYKSQNEIDMFLGITFNNLMVAFRTYVLGIFLGIGTLGSLLFNGIMVGAFQYYFIQRDLFAESALTIWLHGTIEISCIVIAGGAGLTLARGLVFPGTYSRLQSLQISGIRSLKLMLGVAPLIVLAGIIESFLTRYTEAPTYVRLSLIILSALFIIGYFIVFPWMKSRSGFEIPLRAIRLQASIIEPVNYHKVKNNADILKDTFQFYSKFSSKLLPWIFGISVVLAGTSMFFEVPMPVTEDQEWWVVLFSELLFAMETPSPIFIGINGLATAIVLYRLMSLIVSDFSKEKETFRAKAFIQILILAILLFAAIYLGSLGVLITVLAIGIFVFMAFVQFVENTNLVYAFARSWELFVRQGSQGFMLQFITLLLSFSMLLLLSAPLVYIHLHILKWSFLDTDPFAQQSIHFIEMLLKYFSMYLVVPLVTASISYFYFSQDEINSASALKASIDKIGSKTLKSRR